MVVWGGMSFDAVDANEAQRSDGYSFDPARRTITWTRDQLFTDGAAYSPARDSWRTLAPAPARRPWLGTPAAWTGKEMLVLAADDDGRPVGLAYDPKRDRWRVTAAPPAELAGPETAVWAGSEMIVWSGGRPDNVARQGAAYDPAADSWRLLPDSPLGYRRFHSAVWTGTEMIIWGGSDGRTDVDTGAGYSPLTDTWRLPPASPVASRQWHGAIWTGEEMIVWGGQAVGAANDGAAYRPRDDSWRRLPGAPLAGRHWHTWLSLGGVAIAWGGYDFYADEAVYDDGARYDPIRDQWEPLPPAPLTRRCRHSSVWTGQELLLWGGTRHCGTYGPRAADGAALAVTR
jgi:hypothetical protein